MKKLEDMSIAFLKGASFWKIMGVNAVACVILMLAKGVI